MSNEAGIGLMLPHPLGRANQRLDAAADRGLLMVAGLPLVVK